MTEIVLPPNHVTLFFQYLAPKFPAGVVVTEEPDGEDYNQEGLLVIVKDGGQSGPRGYTFWDCLTTIEVRDPDRRKALEVSRKIDGLLRGIPDTNVHYLSSLNNPTYLPDVERKIPAYSWTVEHLIRGESTQIEDISFQ